MIFSALLVSNQTQLLRPWFDHEISWKKYSDLPKVKFRIIQTIMFATEETQDVLEINTIAQKGPIEIKESKYSRIDPAFVAAQQKHLSPQQQDELAALLHNWRWIG